MSDTTEAAVLAALAAAKAERRAASNGKRPQA
jgi:hypothetical protein